MKFCVYYSCERGNENGRIELTFSEFDDSKCIRDIKKGIQDAIQAPICDQKLFYQGKLLTDDNMQLSRLYFREGDSFHVHFLAVADIKGISVLLDDLKAAADEIVNDLSGKLLDEYPSKLLLLSGRLSSTVANLAVFFLPWKNQTSVAQRHYVVQEGGFDAFLEIFKFSRNLYMLNQRRDEHSLPKENREEMQNSPFNFCQLFLWRCCLSFLWNFAETPENRKFALSKGVLPLTIEALLLNPQSLMGSNRSIDNERESFLVVSVNQGAIGCCGGLVESDSSTQEEVSRMSPLIDKILFMIDRRQPGLQDYSLFSSQVASNTLFYCTFNVRSAQLLMDMGVITKMLDITRHFLLDQNGDTPLRYYCCLFLARMRSAPLIRLDKDTCHEIDELINMFLEKHLPREISAWEEETSYVWVTMVPLFHLAFAAGIESHLDSKVNESQQLASKHVERTGQREPTLALGMYGQATQVALGPPQSQGWECSEASNSLAQQEPSQGGWECKSQQTFEVLNSSPHKRQSCVAWQGTNFRRPGSKSTQKLGIFALVHMLSIKENQELALLENLVDYLVCLSWQLNSHNAKDIHLSLSNFKTVSPPSLKVITKSVLARLSGLDMVYHH